MNLQTRPKLFLPKALLWSGPMPYQASAMKAHNQPASRFSELSRIVAEMID